MKKRWFIVPVVVAVLASALLAPPVLACECEEWVNPHGENVPPAGWSTEPGTNPNSGKNPDGFYRIKSITQPGEIEIYFSYVGGTDDWGSSF